MELAYQKLMRKLLLADLTTAEHCLGETAKVSHKDRYLIHVKLELRATTSHEPPLWASCVVLISLGSVKVWLRETSSVRCIAVVVNSLTCIVSDKQLTSGLAGISMTLFLQHLAVFGVVVINSWSLETRERKRERKHLKRKSKFWTGLLAKTRSCISM